MNARQATPKEIRSHYKALGYEVRIDKTEQVEFRRNRDRFPGSPQVWLWGGRVNEYRVDEEVGVYLP
jgi:hypothetical protein